MRILTIIINILLLLALITGLYFLGSYLYHLAHYTHVTAVFEQAEPFPNRMKVFYRGFKIGKVVKVVPNSTYTSTLVKITLFPMHIKIPSNVEVKIKSYHDKYYYVDIVSPELASTEFLKDGDEIKGSVSQNVNAVFNSHADDGTLEALIQGLIFIFEGVNRTVNETNSLVQEIRTTFHQASPNLVESSKNLNTISTNFSGTSLKLNNSVDQAKLNRTLNNLENSSNKLQNIMQSVDCATRNLPNTMERVDCITKDVQEITEGVNNTMKKPFGGARLIMGKPIQDSCKCE